MPELNISFRETALEPVPVLAVRRTMKPDELQQFMGPMLQQVRSAVDNQGLKAAGPPCALYHTFSPALVDLEAAFETDRPGRTEDGVEAKKLFGGRVAIADYFGDFSGLHDAHTAFHAWMKAQRLKPTGVLWEQYLTDPSTEPDPAKWHTRIHYLLADS